MSTSTSTSGISPDVSELKDMVKALLLDKKIQSQAPAHTKIHRMSKTRGKTCKAQVEQLGLLRIKGLKIERNHHPKWVLHIKYPRLPSTSHPSPLKVMNRDTEVTKDTMLPTNNGSTEDVQPPVIQVQSQNPTSEAVVDPVSVQLMPKQRYEQSIPFPSRRNDKMP
ncbi:hypothetical protein Tco_0645564 [Tanacetum coccineum]